MKKTYIAPSISITNVRVENMLALSANPNDTISGGHNFIRQDREWDIWGEASNDEDWEDDY